MGLLDLFARKRSSEVTEFRNETEFRAFVLASTKDEQIADLLVEVARHIGREGYVEIASGGIGKPYAVEYQSLPDDKRTRAEVQAEYLALKQQIAAAALESEREVLEKKLAYLCGGFCTIRINTFSPEDFEKRRALIREAWARCKHGERL